MPFLHNLQTVYTQLGEFFDKLGLLGTHFPCFVCINRVTLHLETKKIEDYET
jgi:hypothetical protein